jgi:hypothetical protein
MRAHEFVTETRLVFKRNPRTGKISLKWRCTSGPRANRTVAHPRDCAAAPDLGKREQMKKTRARTKIRQARRTKRTKKINPQAKLAARLNALRKMR